MATPTKMPDWKKQQITEAQKAVKAAAVANAELIARMPDFLNAFSRAKVASAAAERKLASVDLSGSDVFSDVAPGDASLALLGGIATVGLRHEDITAIGLMLNMSTDRVEGLLDRAARLFSPETFLKG